MNYVKYFFIYINLIFSFINISNANDLIIQNWLNKEVKNIENKLNAEFKNLFRIKIEINKIYSKLKLNSCDKIIFYIPNNEKLWGKSKIGLKCKKKEKTLYAFIPVTIKAFAKAWVANKNIKFNEVLTQDSFILTDVDWAKNKSLIIINQKNWLNKKAAKIIKKGQELRESSIKINFLVNKGEEVTVLIKGENFILNSFAKAVQSGNLGQEIKILMKNKQIIFAKVIDKDQVEIKI